MMDPKDDVGTESRRQQDRRRRKEAGERSARLARVLMELEATALKSLRLTAEVREAAERGRKIRSNSARRREERRLAGVLRDTDLDEIEAALEAHLKSSEADGTAFRRAETWRAQLISEGQSALKAFLAEHPGHDEEPLSELVENARREQQLGWPKGAAKRLFRELMRVLQT